MQQVQRFHRRRRKRMRKLGVRRALRGAAVVLALAVAWSGAAAEAGKDASASGKGAQAGKTRGAETAARTALIDVNTADVDTLSELPGIGRAIAQRIVDYRKEHGPFKSVDELLNVRGIGDRSLARIRERVTVGEKS